MFAAPPASRLSPGFAALLVSALLGGCDVAEDPPRRASSRAVGAVDRGAASPTFDPEAADRPAQTLAVDHWRPPPIDEPLPSPRDHFLVGNESRHDLFAPWIAGRGGAYLGVGSTQNYTMIAVVKPAVAFLLDRDPAVIALHRELGRRIAASPDAGGLIAGLAAPPEGPLAAAWPAVVAHLERSLRPPAEGAFTWLSDPVLYDRVHRQWREGQVMPVVGDLGGSLAMPSIAASAAGRGAHFTVLYLSNAEEGIADRAALRRNLEALPLAGDGLVLRTFYREAEPAADGLWSYQVHGIDDLLARLAGVDRGAPTIVVGTGLTTIAATRRAYAVRE